MRRRSANSWDGHRRTAAIAGVLLAVAGLAVLILTGPVVGGDAIADFQLPEEGQSAEAGDSVEIPVTIASDGGYDDEGVVAYEFVLAVPTSVGEPTAVEPGPWLAQGDGRVNQTVTDAGPGAIRVRHERVGAIEGVTGRDRAATVTVVVAEDAPSADATVLVADPQATLRGSDYRMRSFGDETTLTVGGGGASLAPAYDPGSDVGGSVDVRTAAERNRTVDRSEDSSGGDDPLPAPGVTGAIVALAGALLVGVLVGRKGER